jgi:hypothetical protein
MLSDLAEQLRGVSNSHAFEQFLKYNPELTRDASRELLSLQYLKILSGEPGYDSPFYAGAVVGGYNASAPSIPYEPAPAPPPPSPPPQVVSAGTANLYGFQLWGYSGNSQQFDFASVVGDSILYNINVSSVAPGQSLQVDVTETTDSFLLYMASRGVPLLDVNVFRYNRSIALGPGCTSSRIIQTYAQLATYGPQVYVVVRQVGSLPFMYGTLTTSVI